MMYAKDVINFGNSVDFVLTPISDALIMSLQLRWKDVRTWYIQ